MKSKMNQIKPSSHVTLTQHENFNGYPVQHQNKQLIEKYLVINENVLLQAIRHHKRVCVMRFDLKIPPYVVTDGRLISRFFESLKGRIDVDIKSKNKQKRAIIERQNEM